VAGKQASYHAIAEYYQSMQAKEAKDFGEEIARLRVSDINRYISKINDTFITNVRKHLILLSGYYI